MNKKYIDKISTWSLIICIVTMLIGMKYELFEYVSLAALIFSYAMNLVKEKAEKGKINPVSIILCLATISWLIMKQFTHSKYTLAYGQTIVYVYLIYTQWQLLGVVKKDFVAYVVAAVGTSLLRVYYPGFITSALDLLMLAWIIFRFLDPILYKIAMLHREKRLAEEAKRNASEEENFHIRSEQKLISSEE